MSGKRVIVVTGSYKGIGFEIVRLLSELYGDRATVFMTARDPTRAQSSLDNLRAKGLNNVELAQLDISSKESVTKLKELIETKYNGVINGLVNNAAVSLTGVEPWGKMALETVKNNYYGHILVSEALNPLIAPGGIIVNVIGQMSRLGQVSQHYQKILWNAPNVETVSAVMDEFVQAAQHGKHQQAGFANNALATSKLGVHAVARVHAKQLYAKKISVINMCPGWCKTDMAGWDRAPMTAAEGADTVVWLETMNQADQFANTGGFFQKRRPISW